MRHPDRVEPLAGRPARVVGSTVTPAGAALDAHQHLHRRLAAPATVRRRSPLAAISSRDHAIVSPVAMGRPRRNRMDGATVGRRGGMTAGTSTSRRARSLARRCSRSGPGLLADAGITDRLRVARTRGQGARSAVEHMEEITRALEAATWAAVEGEASDQQLGLLEADPVGWKLALERLIDATEDGLDEAEQLTGPERPQVIADFEEELDRLFAAYDLLLATKDTGAIAHAAAEPPGVVRLQASWTAGDVVLWAAGPNTMPANRAELAERLEAIGGPSLGGVEHPGVTLPTGARAEARSIPLTEALGWLAAVGGGLGGDEVGASVTWLGQVVLTAVRLVARGARSSPCSRASARPAAVRSTWRCAGRRPSSTTPSSPRWPRPCPGRSPRCTGPIPARSPSTCSAPSSTPSPPTPPAAWSCPPPLRSPTPPRPSPRPWSPGSTARTSRPRWAWPPACRSGSTDGSSR